MAMPKDEIQSEMVNAWRIYLDHLEEALNKVEKQIGEASEMASICTDEWCEATEHYIYDLANALFTISEPRFADPEDSKRIKKLKKKVYDLYADYKGAYQAANA